MRGVSPHLSFYAAREGSRYKQNAYILRLAQDGSVNL